MCAILAEPCQWHRTFSARYRYCHSRHRVPLSLERMTSTNSGISYVPANPNINRIYPESDTQTIRPHGVPTQVSTYCGSSVRH
ncbi:hypothetical protein BJX63DRAFT_151161 [Aspergillus granulosus]|uniref:Uncharacterized protein n=1 Tax=Aspergillus granulosus TaxID=176169 RepID=A0ABR4GRU6_9EURO